MKRGGGNSVNQGFGEDFYRKGDSVKRFGPFIEPPDSENWKVAVLIPFPKIRSNKLIRADDFFRRENFPGGPGTGIPGHLRPVIIKPVGRIFEISDSNPIRGKCGKCGRSLSRQKNKGLRRFHWAKKRKRRKMRKRRKRKCGKCGKCGWLTLMWLALGDPQVCESLFPELWSKRYNKIGGRNARRTNGSIFTHVQGRRCLERPLESMTP